MKNIHFGATEVSVTKHILSELTVPSSNDRGRHIERKWERERRFDRLS